MYILEMLYMCTSSYSSSKEKLGLHFVTIQVNSFLALYRAHAIFSSVEPCILISVPRNGVRL